MKIIPIKERFWSKVKKSRGCWIWTGAKCRQGYGQLYAKKRLFIAHRYSYVIHKGLIGNLNVLHTCDNPSCVNPRHLFLGTHKDNMQDKYRKNRQNMPACEQHWNSKLSASDIKYIRKQKRYRGLGVKLAKRFNVTKENINYILRNETWKNI